MHSTVVCLSVCHVHDPKSTTEGRSKLRIGKKEAHDTGEPWPHLEVERSKVTRQHKVVTENQPYRIFVAWAVEAGLKNLVF